MKVSVRQYVQALSDEHLLAIVDGFETLERDGSLSMEHQARNIMDAFHVMTGNVNVQGGFFMWFTNFVMEAYRMLWMRGVKRP
jgi:hypothetical protein